jgi:hypothetical protein
MLWKGNKRRISLDGLQLNAKEAAYSLGISSHLSDQLEENILEGWPIVVTDPRISRKSKKFIKVKNT